MRKLALIILILLFPATVAAANLTWDYDEAARSDTDGFTLYFSDGTNNYTKTFLVSETTVEGTSVSWPDVEEKCNMHPGVEYQMSLARYNSTAESVASNTITYTMEAYNPPPDALPDPVTSEPAGVNGIGVE